MGRTGPGKVTVSFGTSKAELEKLALGMIESRRSLRASKIVKIVVVADKQVNIVIKG